MTMTFILIAIGALATVTKRLVQQLENLVQSPKDYLRGWRDGNQRKVETIQTRALFRQTRILKKVLET